MNDILIRYMFPAAISLLALYALFAMTLRNQTFFGWNRVFLVVSIVLSFILPLIHIPVNISSSEVMTNYSFSITPQEIVIETDTANKSFLSLLLLQGKKLLFYLYILGAIVFTLRLLVGLFRIVYLIHQYGIVHYQGSKVVFMQNNMPHFSFFNLVFINRNFLESAQEELILLHEKEHLRQRHFIDLILLELLIVFQWFNPASWLYRHSLKRIHEYQADKAVVKSGYETKEYMYLIYKQVSGFRPDVFINKFNFFTLKKRIIMMSKKESSVWAKSRILLAVPMIALLLLCFGLQANSQENKITTMVFNVDADESAELITISKMNPDGSFSILQDSVAFELMTEGNTLVFQSKDGEQTFTVSMNEATTTLHSTQDTVYSWKSSKENLSDDKEEVFVIVEKVPEFPGGDEARLEFLRSNIRYPDEAKEKRIQGTVYIGFIVEKDGTVTNVKILKGIGKVCDDEAIRVTKLMPKWTPGKQKGKVVRVQYQMPIKFTLAKDDKESDQNDEAFVIVEQTPEFPGGDEVRLEFLRSNITYPAEAKEKGIQGTVFIGFIVEKDGTVTNVKILRGIGKVCDDEAIRVTKLMPKWTPGKQKGKVVRVQYQMPIKFSLAKDEK